MTTTEQSTFDGGCDCGKIRYRLTSKPLVIHCCHCSWCQRESGSAFAVNALFESDRVVLQSSDAPKIVQTPSASGGGQTIVRCPSCFVAVWSNYSDNRDLIRFIKVGTLDDPAALGDPDVHIYTSTKRSWVNLDNSPVPVKEGWYDRHQEVWSQESLERARAYFEKTADQSGSG